MTLKMASSSGEQLPGQVVLVLQGGGALGAYQVGVYQALHEAGVEPDWVIGTSIGAVNGAIIAGNETKKRLPRLHEFWDKVRLGGWVEPMAGPWANHWYANLSTYIGGIPGFFMPRAIPWGGMYAPLGVYSSSWYRTEPLHATLAPLIDFELLKAKRTRLTVGAVNVKSGELRYFDNTRDPQPLTLEHVMASGALPPAFPAIAVDGDRGEGGRQRAGSHHVLEGERLRVARVVEVAQLAALHVDRADGEARALRFQQLEVDERRERRVQRLGAVPRRGVHAERRVHAAPGNGARHEEAGNAADVRRQVGVPVVRPRPGHRLDPSAEPHLVPELVQARQALFRFISGDDRAVDRADRGADDPVGLDACLVQRLVDADLVGAERAAALQHENHLPRQLLAAARSHLQGHGARFLPARGSHFFLGSSAGFT